MFAARRQGELRATQHTYGVALSPEKIVEGVAGSATSTVYTIMATLLCLSNYEWKRSKMGGYWLGVNHRRGCENLRTKDQELWSMAVLTKHGSFFGSTISVGAT